MEEEEVGKKKDDPASSWINRITKPTQTDRNKQSCWYLLADSERVKWQKEEGEEEEEELGSLVMTSADSLIRIQDGISISTCHIRRRRNELDCCGRGQCRPPSPWQPREEERKEKKSNDCIAQLFFACWSPITSSGGTNGCYRRRHQTLLLSLLLVYINIYVIIINIVILDGGCVWRGGEGWVW